MKKIRPIFLVILLLSVIVAGSFILRNQEHLVPLHDTDVFVSKDQVKYVIKDQASNLSEQLRYFDYAYFQNINNPKMSKMFYIVSVNKDEVKMTRYERKFDEAMYTFYIESADETYFITDMDAAIKVELVSHTGFRSIDSSVLMQRDLRRYEAQDDGVHLNPEKILINFKLLEDQAEFTLGRYPNLDSRQYSVKFIKEDSE